MNTIAALYVDIATAPTPAFPENIDLWHENTRRPQVQRPPPRHRPPTLRKVGKLLERFRQERTRPATRLGADGGCFEAALHAVRTYGGVLEHPANSHAWETFGINRPETQGGWLIADTHGAYTTQVWQGWYGHRTAKATWLYALGTPLPALRWGKSTKTHAISNLLYFKPSMRLFDDVPHVQPKPQVKKSERRQTPTPFRDLLIAMARAANPANAPSNLFATIQDSHELL